MISAADIQKMADIIVARFAPEKVILFGSYAQGCPDEGSDVDLIVVLDTDEDLIDKTAEVRMALHGFPVAKDVLLRTPTQFRKECEHYWTVFSEANNGGRVLYERAS
jgi:predicted nucleotidyltransferase